MKHLFIFFIALLNVGNIWSQGIIGLKNPSSPTTTLPYSYVPQDDDEISLTWLTGNDKQDAFGFKEAAEIGGYMEFYPADLINFNNTGKRPIAIKQVQFYMDDVSCIGQVNVVIRRGESLGTSSEVVKQQAVVSKGWNYIDLNEEYTIDPSQRLYVGCETTISGACYPFGLAAGTQAKQGWLLLNGIVENTTSAGYVLMIKAVASAQAAPDNAITLQSLIIPQTSNVNTNVNIRGIVRNFGKTPLTAFTVEYSIDGQSPISHTFTGLSIAPNATYTFTHPEPFVADISKTYTVNVNVSKPNGEGEVVNNSLSTKIMIYAESEIALQSVSLPTYKLVNDSVFISGVIKNLGTVAIDSFTVEYRIGDSSPVSHTFTDLSIAIGRTYTFNHPIAFLLGESRTYSINLTVSHPNGEEDLPDNNSLSANIQGYDRNLDRVLLHENFTSSTCGPCSAGNATLLSILNNIDDESKWVNIRYQMNFPDTGDPYYTKEGGIRRDYYGVNAIPDLKVDGKGYSGNPGAYSVSKFNQLAAIPAIIAMSGRAETIGRKIQIRPDSVYIEYTVNADISITPTTNMDTEKLKVFAAIVEKTTTKNKKGNGETLFHNVMKKFLTKAQGDSIESFELNVAKDHHLSFTFKGNHRLPANAGNEINPEIEHSVENFDNLIVVYWVQNMETKEVLQAGKADAMLSILDGLPTISADNKINAFISNDLLHINSTIPVQNITIYTISGQKILSMPATEKALSVERLVPGVYVVKLQTTEGDKTVKVSK